MKCEHGIEKFTCYICHDEPVYNPIVYPCPTCSALRDELLKVFRTSDIIPVLIQRNRALRAEVERLQEELEAAACQLGAQDAKLVRYQTTLEWAIGQIAPMDSGPMGEVIPGLGLLRPQCERIADELRRRMEGK